MFIHFTIAMDFFKGSSWCLWRLSLNLFCQQQYQNIFYYIHYPLTRLEKQSSSLSRNKISNVDERRHPCWIPILLFILTFLFHFKSFMDRTASYVWTFSYKRKVTSIHSTIILIFLIISHIFI
jgi:hypothetical protein